jgi:signal peptidase I
MDDITSVKKTKRKTTRELYEWAESIILALICVILLLTFTFRGTIVDGGSMMPTLHDEQFLTLIHVYGELNYNDIVVVYATRLDGGKPIIKRVIGLPGDTIRIDFEEGIVYRNGTALEIEHRDGIIYEEGHIINSLTTDKHDMSDRQVVVPDNHIFILGDNRNSSIDSRDRRVGMVDRNYVIGKILFRVTPFELFGPVT